jgi:hypothetical protein
MSDPVIIAECIEPWLFWWELLSKDAQAVLEHRYKVTFPSPEEKAFIWQNERPHPLQDNDWIELADRTFRDAHLFQDEDTKEIWRQVYRIASEKI